MRRLVFGLLALISLVALPACSGGDGSGSDNSSTNSSVTDEREAAIAFAEAHCEVAYECPRQATGEYSPIIRGFSSAEECKQVARQKPRAFVAGPSGSIVRSLLSDRLELDGTDASSCVEAYKSFICREAPNAETLEQTCDDVLAPQVEQGGTCGTSIECTGDLECEGISLEQCEGTCKPPDEAEDCGGETCAEDEFCSSSSCAPKPAEGESCAEGIVPCESGSWCVPDPDGDSATCVAESSRGEGEHCGDSDLVCAEDLTCVDGSCTPYQQVEEGSACAGTQVCKPGVPCVEPSPGAEPVCRKGAGPGESCESRFCRNDLYCTEDNTCRKRRANGESCSSDFDCLSGNCNDGTCAASTACSINEL
jgi:hypothetical protein